MFPGLVVSWVEVVTGCGGDMLRCPSVLSYIIITAFFHRLGDRGPGFMLCVSVPHSVPHGRCHTPHINIVSQYALSGRIVSLSKWPLSYLHSERRFKSKRAT